MGVLRETESVIINATLMVHLNSGPLILQFLGLEDRVMMSEFLPERESWVQSTNIQDIDQRQRRPRD
jgi:hypothetical protein